MLACVGGTVRIISRAPDNCKDNDIEFIVTTIDHHLCFGRTVTQTFWALNLNQLQCNDLAEVADVCFKSSCWQ